MVKKTGTELAVVTPEEQAYIASVTAGQPSNTGLGIARVNFVIDLEKDTQTGEKIMPGQIKIVEEDQPNIYTSSLKLRPIRQYKQVIKTVEDKETKKYKLVSQSLYFTDWKTELLDTAGGIACGRKFGKDLKGMTDEEAAGNKKLANLYEHVFALATLPDGTVKPVHLRLGGRKMVEMGKATKAIPDKTVPAHYNFNIELLEVTLDTGKLGYDLQVTPLLDEKLPLTDILAFDAEITAYINSENKRITDTHLQANKYKNRDVSNAAGIADEFDDSKLVDITPGQSDLDDEIPF